MEIINQKFINPENIRVINLENKEIYLIGTAHVLKESQEEVKQLIEAVSPDSVCVELCESRYSALKNPDKWKNLDIIKVIKEGKGFLLFAQLVLSAFQRRIGLNLDTKPGEEMLAAINLAEQKNINIVLADRDISITLKRAWKLSSFKAKIKIIEVLIESIFTKENIKENEIKELMEEKDIYSEIMEIFAKELPEVKKVFIDERNIFLANKILKADGKKIVAVIGKGHLDGIKDLLEKGFIYTDEIETVPEKKKSKIKLSYIIPIIILLIFIAGFFKGKKVAAGMFLAWIISNGFFTSIFALAVLAHPLTILMSWIVSPITSLNPTIGAGIVLSILEATFRKPRVEDFENLLDDITTFKGFFKNRITKILLVFIATSIGSSIGTFVALPYIVSLLK